MAMHTSDTPHMWFWVAGAVLVVAAAVVLFMIL